MLAMPVVAMLPAVAPAVRGMIGAATTVQAAQGGGAAGVRRGCAGAVVRRRRMLVFFLLLVVVVPAKSVGADGAREHAAYGAEGAAFELVA